VPWGRDDPPTVDQGLEFLEELRGLLSGREAEFRGAAFEQAGNAIRRAGEAGGVPFDRRVLWGRTNDLARGLGEWTMPWLDESWRDGNPIFSAWSPLLRRGVRIIQHNDPSCFAVGRRIFGEAAAGDAVDELMISCAPTAETLQRVSRMLERWLTERGGVVTANRELRGPLSTEDDSLLNDGGGEPLAA
jgi:hypothetical protein